MIGHISTLASTPEDLGHLLCRPALPVLTVATTVPGRFSGDYASGSSFSGVQARRGDEWRALARPRGRRPGLEGIPGRCSCAVSSKAVLARHESREGSLSATRKPS
jgi:hypothetical protein